MSRNARKYAARENNAPEKLCTFIWDSAFYITNYRDDYQLIYRKIIGSYQKGIAQKH
ncbi:MAG: hypothetical protein ACTTJ7_08770 [Treponema sp.]